MGHYRKNHLVWLFASVALFLWCSPPLFAEKGTPRPQNDRRFSAPQEPISQPVTPSESRVALLIGNADYPSSPLSNPLNDVRTLASILKGCGFEVFAYENLTNQGMIDAMGTFEDKLSHKDVGLFYFSGHGMQIRGENFLVPVDANCQRESQASYECFNVGRLLGVMEIAKARVNIVILDACRNNPLTRGYRSLGGGLAKMDAGNQMIIAYSTSPGEVAQDGPSGGNSPYLSGLVNQIRLPGQEIELMFKNVRKNVMKSTGGNQKPWENTSLTDSFCFIPTDKPIPQPARSVETQHVAPPQPRKETSIPDYSPQIAAINPEVTNSIGMKLRLIPAGSFMMGSEEGDSGEKPVHRVNISKPFYIGVYEITQEEYEKVMGTSPSKFKGASRPVESVCWDDAIEFCRKLSQMERIEYRLPTEAEWEYACRAGTATDYYWGNEINDDFCWNTANSGNTTHDVGLKKPNQWALFDMSGNVWEWCQDWYDQYPSFEQTDPAVLEANSVRLSRGGSWDSVASFYSSSHRAGNNPSKCWPYRGFRAVRTP